MSPLSVSALVLVGYVAWTLLLVLAIVSLRSGLVLAGRRRPDGFTPAMTELSPAAERLARAHQNCVENLPMVASLVLLAEATGHTDVTDPTAIWLLAARIGQTLTHLASGGPVAVQVRFGFFVVQLAILFGWVLGFALG